jgi:hypothetical protein
MSLIAKKLQDTIAKSPNGGGSEAEVLLKRIAYVNEHVMPIAQEKVLEAVRANKSSHERKGMADLLQRFNGSMSDSQREALIRWDSP